MKEMDDDLADLLFRTCNISFLLKQCIFSPPQIEIVELIVLLVGASLSAVLCFWFSKAKVSKSGWCCSRNVSFCACKTWLCSVSVNIRDETSLWSDSAVVSYMAWHSAASTKCVVTSSLHLWLEEKKEATLFSSLLPVFLQRQQWLSEHCSASQSTKGSVCGFALGLFFRVLARCWPGLFFFLPFLTLNVRCKTRHTKQNCSKKVETF